LNARFAFAFDEQSRRNDVINRLWRQYVWLPARNPRASNL
jgi:hypothetical protein